MSNPSHLKDEIFTLEKSAYDMLCIVTLFKYRTSIFFSGTFVTISMGRITVFNFLVTVLEGKGGGWSGSGGLGGRALGMERCGSRVRVTVRISSP